VEVIFNNAGNRETRRQLGNYAIETYKSGSKTTAYLFTDHLGSVDVITDNNGQVLQNMSFSAWGERRLPTDWNAMTISQTRSYISDYTTKGFTGHEMLDAFGIINMGGRIYDAALGRVLQADPFVQEPTNSQSFNRYTYVFNNPLSYTDPSGFITLRQVIGIAVGIALAYFLGPLVSKLWHAMLVGFTSGFVSGAIITGSLKGALKSGLIGAAVAGVMFQVTGGAADKGNPKAAKSGGVKDNIHSNGFEGANSAVNTTHTASSEALEMVAEQGGSTAAQSVGQATESNVRELSKVYVYGNPVAEGATLSQVRRLALGTNSLFQIRHDMAEALVESYATDLDAQTVNAFRKTYNDLNVIYKEVRRIVGGRIAFASGVGTVVSTATMFTPIGFTRGAVGKLVFNGGKTFQQYKKVYWARNVKPRLEPIINPKTGQVWKQYAELHHKYIPQRWNVPNWLKNNRFNIKEMTSLEHAMVDVFRARFAPKWVKELYNLKWK
jgi:RHS repeat-associated protein